MQESTPDKGSEGDIEDNNQTPNLIYEPLVSSFTDREELVKSSKDILKQVPHSDTA